MIPKCFGAMMSAGFDKDCDRCLEKSSCLIETNRRLKLQEEKQSPEAFGAEVKYCPANVPGECE